MTRAIPPEQYFDPYKEGIEKTLKSQEINNLHARTPPKEVKHSNIFSGLGLSQEESNLAHHFTTSSDNYLNKFNKTSPNHALPTDNNDIRLHLFGRFAKTLEGTSSHNTVISLLDKLAKKGLIDKRPGGYKIRKFSIKRNQPEPEPKKKTKNITEIEDSDLADDVEPVVTHEEVEEQSDKDNINDVLDSSEDTNFLDEPVASKKPESQEMYAVFDRLFDLYSHRHEHLNLVKTHKDLRTLISKLKEKNKEIFTPEELLLLYQDYIKEKTNATS